MKYLKKITHQLLVLLVIFGWVFSGFLPLWEMSFLPRQTREAHAANFSMQTGYYIGNGVKVTIDGLGFKPDFLIIKADTTASGAMFKTSAMPESDIAYFSATVSNYSGRVKLEHDGFTVGEDTKINIDSDGFTVNQSASLVLENVRYTWIAFTGSDCTASGTLCVGMYTGDGNSPRTITTGFDPTFVMVKRSTAVGAHFHTASQPTSESAFFANVVRDTAGNYIRSFTGAGFSVGATDNTAGGIYYYVAFKTSAGVMTEGTYTANNTDNTSISGLGFKPNFVFVKNATNATANNTYGTFLTSDSYGDNAGFFTATANAVNNIQALESDGFQLGNSIYTNGSASDTHYYVAFGGAPAPAGSGSFTMAEGTYTGNGVGQAITNLGFAPDLVIVKDGRANYAVFRTRLMGGNSSAYMSSATANIPSAIVSLDSAGFTIASSTLVNTENNTYYYQAFGNAYNPHTKTGSADFAIGAYYGNGIDNRSITDIPFQPDFVTVKSITNAGAGVWRTSSLDGDTSLFFANTASSSNNIQALASDGFQIGTSAVVNTSAVTYFWFAFKDGTNFATGSYVGNNTDNTDITGVGFQPSLVWIKSSTTQYAVSKPASFSGDLTNYFYNAASTTNAVQSISTDGFQVGSSALVNSNAITYYYAGWRVPVSAVISITLDRESFNYGAMTSNTSSSTLGLWGGVGITATNDGNVIEDFDIYGANTADWTLSGTAGPDIYVHQFCNDTDNACDAPPVGYTALTTSPQTLKTGIGSGGTVVFQLLITTPNESSVFNEQSAVVTIQASQP
jgi:hypothetical protein